ncbi:MAG: alanine racemase [Actinomycetaceae bacterium]|nr:alanine racemase [Actinomycetaceae bacterium]
MTYPQLLCKTQDFAHNAKLLKDRLAERGLSLVVVTKLVSGNYQLISGLLKHVEAVGESRLENLKHFPYAGVQRWLIRIPSLDEVKDVVKYADLSLNSEISVLQALDSAAQDHGVIHDVILMVEVGDLREGVEPANVIETVGEILKLKNLRLRGLGTNLGCFGSIEPDTNNMGTLADLVEEVEKTYDIELDINSAATSIALPLVMSDKMPAKITNARVGEAIFRGHVPSINEAPELGLRTNSTTLQAQIIELKEKNSIPTGTSGILQFQRRDLEEQRRMKRAIVNLGQMDVSINELMPQAKGVHILGASSDHMICDVTDFEADGKTASDLKVGDILSFSLTYLGLSQAFSSTHITKKAI